MFLTQVTEASNSPENIDSYVLRDREVKLVRPRYNSESENFLGLYETVGFFIVRGDPDEVFFNDGFDKQNSKVLYSHYKRRILNAFSGAIFNRHRSMLESGELES